MFLNKIRNIFCVSDTKFVSATNVARAGKRGNICVGNNVSSFARAFKGTGKRGHIVAHDVSWARKRAGHKMNVVFSCCANRETPVADTTCVRNKCCARGQTWKHLCRQQCVLVCHGLKTQAGIFSDKRSK